MPRPLLTWWRRNVGCWESSEERHLTQFWKASWSKWCLGWTLKGELRSFCQHFLFPWEIVSCRCWKHHVHAWHLERNTVRWGRAHTLVAQRLVEVMARGRWHQSLPGRKGLPLAGEGREGVVLDLRPLWLTQGQRVWKHSQWLQRPVNLHESSSFRRIITPLDQSQCLPEISKFLEYLRKGAPYRNTLHNFEYLYHEWKLRACCIFTIKGNTTDSELNVLEKYISLKQIYRNYVSLNYNVFVLSVIRLSAEELMLFSCGVGEDSWEFLGQQGDQTSQS